MLVLNRKRDQSILIPELGIKIKITRIQQNNVRVALEVPEQYRVFREEVYQKILSQHTPAVAVTKDHDARIAPAAG